MDSDANLAPGMTSQKPSASYFWPAEWEKQEAVWLSWPHRHDLWQGKLDFLSAKFAEVCAKIGEFSKVRINAAKSIHASIQKHLDAKFAQNTRIFDHPTNDVWCRDHGPIFVKNESGDLVLTDWEFNAWGGKFAPWNLDNQIPFRIANALNLPRVSSKLILEGGAIEGNGAGVLLTTEAVLLNKNRNPSWSKKEIEAELRRLLGVTEIFWLNRGIEGDDTDGHIDDMVRFVREDAVIAISEKNPKSTDYQTIQENLERLADLRTLSGTKVEVVPLHLPKPICTENWRLEQLPASYANFLIINDGVIVPIFNQKKNDDHALGILRECFPSHSVIGIDARDLVVEGGAIHCITQQQPAC